MANVYRVGSMYGVTYFNTAREADGHKPNGEEPESVVRLDAAGVCNSLERMVDEAESRLAKVRRLLDELLMVCDPAIVAGTTAGKEAQKYIIDNPLPPATAGDRDGGRSYGV